MRRIFSLTFAGFVGGLIAFLAIQLSDIDNTKVEGFNRSPRAILASNNMTDGSFDFVSASRIATPAVVHISASESKALAQQRIQKERGRDAFDFWGFEDFFGSPYNHPLEGTGSGVIVSEDGYIVTNNHVVEYADQITVSLADKRKFKAEKIGTHPGTDLALLKIEGTGLNAIEFTDSDGVQVGEWVAAIGNPFNYLTSTVTAGIVSAKGRDLDIIKADKKIEAFIQTDAAINPGNSGGALVNTEGQLVGINTAIATPTGAYTGYSFAIPSNLVQKVIKDIKESGGDKRGYLGVRGDSVDKALSEEEKLFTEKGFYIASVDKGSAAHYAGVLPGDVVIGINDQEVENFDDLYKEMAFAKAGETIDLKVLRKNKEINIPVKLRKGI